MLRSRSLFHGAREARTAIHLAQPGPGLHTCTRPSGVASARFNRQGHAQVPTSLLLKPSPQEKTRAPISVGIAGPHVQHAPPKPVSHDAKPILLPFQFHEELVLVGDAGFHVAPDPQRLAVLGGAHRTLRRVVAERPEVEGVAAQEVHGGQLQRLLRDLVDVSLAHLRLLQRQRACVSDTGGHATAVLLPLQHAQRHAPRDAKLTGAWLDAMSRQKRLLQLRSMLGSHRRYTRNGMLASHTSPSAFEATTPVCAR